MTSTEVQSNARVWSLGELPFDTVTSPLDSCCGVLAQLAASEGPTPPMAQVGGAMVFLVRSGSAGAVLASAPLTSACAALGVELGDYRQSGVSPTTVGSLEAGFWVIPPPTEPVELPEATTIVSAIRAANPISPFNQGSKR